MITSHNGHDGEYYDPFKYGSHSMRGIPMWYHELLYKEACACEQQDDHHVTAEHHTPHYSAFKNVCPHTSKEWVEVLEH
jgi:hypothetical protein